MLTNCCVAGSLNPRKRALAAGSEESEAAKKKYTEAQIAAEDGSKVRERDKETERDRAI